MRINSVAQSDAISKYINTVGAKPVKSPLKAEITDSVELSPGAQKFAALLRSAKDSMEIGAAEDAKAADIMAKMNDNAYKIPTGDVVSGIMRGIPTHI